MCQDLSCSFIPLSDRSAWSASIQLAETPVGLLPEYCLAITGGQDENIYLFVARSEQGVFLCPLLERGQPSERDVFTPYGSFAWSEGSVPQRDLVDSCRIFLAQRGYVAAYVALDPCLDWQLNAENCVITETNKAYCLDLGPSLASIEANLAHEHRRRLRQWQEGACRLIFDQDRLRSAFLEIYPDFVRRIGVSAAYQFQQRSLERLVTLEGAQFFGAQSAQGKIDNVLLCLRSGARAETFLNAVSEGGSQHSRALTWAAIEHFKAAGTRQLYMGAGIKPDDNLARFKAGFGGAERSMRALKLVLDQGKFASLCIHAGRYAEENGYFPPYRKTS